MPRILSLWDDNTRLRLCVAVLHRANHSPLNWQPIIAKLPAAYSKAQCKKEFERLMKEADSEVSPDSSSDSSPACSPADAKAKTKKKAKEETTSPEESSISSSVPSPDDVKVKTKQKAKKDTVTPVAQLMKPVTIKNEAAVKTSGRSKKRKTPGEEAERKVKREKKIHEIPAQQKKKSKKEKRAEKKNKKRGGPIADDSITVAESEDSGVEVTSEKTESQSDVVEVISPASRRHDPALAPLLPTTSAPVKHETIPTGPKSMEAERREGKPVRRNSGHDLHSDHRRAPNQDNHNWSAPRFEQEDNIHDLQSYDAGSRDPYGGNATLHRDNQTSALSHEEPYRTREPGYQDSWHPHRASIDSYRPSGSPRRGSSNRYRSSGTPRRGYADQAPGSKTPYVERRPSDSFPFRPVEERSKTSRTLSDQPANLHQDRALLIQQGKSQRTDNASTKPRMASNAERGVTPAPKHTTVKKETPGKLSPSAKRAGNPRAGRKNLPLTQSNGDRNDAQLFFQ